MATGSPCGGGTVGAGRLERGELGAAPLRFGLLLGLAAGPVPAPELPPRKGQVVSLCFQDLRYLLLGLTCAGWYRQFPGSFA